jgi:AraC-like DNA-binding protein
MNSISHHETTKSNSLHFPKSFTFLEGHLTDSASELPLSWHNHIEIFRILEGEGTFVISGRPYRVRAGSFIIINPFEIHSATVNLGRPLTYEKLELNYSYLYKENDPIYKKYIEPFVHGNSYLPNTIIQSFPIHREINQIFDEFQHTANTPNQELHNMLLIYKLLLSFYNNKFVYHKSYTASKKIESTNMIKATINTIHDNYSNHLDLDYLASSINTTKPHLCRLFKRMTAKTITEYHNDYRINKACDLLINTNHSITTIAFQIGYNNISYFNTRFKKKTSLTPIEYRDIYKK